MKSEILLFNRVICSKPVSAFLFSLLLLSFHGLAQTTTTIDYTQALPGLCNVFGSTPIVSGHEHFSVLGQPAQNSAAGVKALEIDCSQVTQYNSDGTLQGYMEFGTQYNIQFPFKQGYSYSFTFTLECGKQASTTGQPTLYYGLTNSNTFNADCSGPESGVSNHPGDNNLVTSSFVVPNFTTTVNMNSETPPSFPTLSGGYAYLAISCLLPNSPNDGTCPIYIKNISIIETAPAGSQKFAISPSTVNIKCGQQTAQTFTATNTAGGTSGVTGYTWTLGANNGWIYNGSAAPSTIVTTANTLTLTSNGGTTSPSPVTLGVNGVTAPVSPATATVSFCSCLTIPTGLTAAVCTTGPTTLSWNAVPGATGYTIALEGTSNVSGAGSITPEGTTTNSYQYGPAPGTPQQFYVTAYNTCGTAPQTSGWYTFTATPQTPQTPTGLTATVCVNGVTTLSWNPVPNATGYTIALEGTSNVSGAGYITPEGTSTNSYTYSPAAGSAQQFYVSAYISCGNAGQSSGWYTFTANPQTLQTPQGLAATVSNGNATISWNPVPGATGYIVALSGPSNMSSAGGFTPYSISTNSLSYFAEPGSTQKFFVNATNNCSNNSLSSATFSYTTPALPCPIPSISYATMLSSTAFYVDWQAVAGVTSYNLKFQQSGSSNSVLITGITGTSYNFTSPVPNALYSVSIQGVCPNGSSPFNVYQDGETIENNKEDSLRGQANSLTRIQDSSSIVENAFKVFPVPSSGVVNVSFNASEEGNAEFVITDMLGTPLIKKTVMTMAGINNYTLNLGRLGNGIYAVTLIQSSKIYVKKLLIQK